MKHSHLSDSTSELCFSKPGTNWTGEEGHAHPTDFTLAGLSSDSSYTSCQQTLHSNGQLGPVSRPEGTSQRDKALRAHLGHVTVKGPALHLACTVLPHKLTQPLREKLSVFQMTALAQPLWYSQVFGGGDRRMTQ